MAAGLAPGATYLHLASVRCWPGHFLKRRRDRLATVVSKENKATLTCGSERREPS